MVKDITNKGAKMNQKIFDKHSKGAINFAINTSQNDCDFCNIEMPREHSQLTKKDKEIIIYFL